MAPSVVEWTGDQIAEAARQGFGRDLPLWMHLRRVWERRGAPQNLAATLLKSLWMTQSSV